MTQIISSTCCYCGVGCGVLIETDGQKVLSVSGDPSHPANKGKLCSKGSTLHLTAGPAGRLQYPEWRSQRGQTGQTLPWDTALEQAAEQFADIIERHGPDSVAFYLSGQMLTEDYYVFNKLAKGLIGTNNVDTNSRLCMSSAVSGYKASLGSDAVPTCYDDIDHADFMLIAGANPAYAHPILFRRIEAAKAANPDLKIVVVDPRKTDTAELADLHLPIAPGTDVALFNGMLHVLLWEGLLDRRFIDAHTEGFHAVKDRVREYTPKMVSDICGVSEDDIIKAALWFGSAQAALSFWCMGLNQSSHGTDNNTALINLHLATGQIGRVGAGPFSLTGQPNAMGGREVGGMANLLSGHRDLANPQHREEVAALWGVDAVPSEPGKTAVDMFEAIRNGQIRAVWIVCTNPAQSLPHQALVREALARCEYVVVQEAYRQTDTTAYADLLLPATSWAEKEGTVTNSERRITHVKPAIPGPGEAKADWWIGTAFAQKLEQRLRPGKASLFAYETAEDVFAEHVATTAGRDLDITGLNFATLDEKGPQQWPMPLGATSGKARLYEDGVFSTPTGRARFVDVRYTPVAEPIDARYPLHLLSGRLRDHWHGMSRTGTVPRLFSHVEEPAAYMAPAEMARRRLQAGELIRVQSRRGQVVMKLLGDEGLAAGQVFIPMHWGSQFMKGEGANALTLPIYDPISRQPELKHAAVRVESVHLPWQMVVMVMGDAVELREALQPQLAHFEFGSLALFGREQGGVILQVAASEPPHPSWLQELDQLLGLDDPEQVLSYYDPRRGVSKRVRLQEGRILSVRLTGETAAKDWLKSMMLESSTVDAIRSWVLAPLSTPPAGGSKACKVVCNCKNVSEDAIIEAIRSGAHLDTLKDTLGCGTQCGSCVPEIKRMVVQFKP